MGWVYMGGAGPAGGKRLWEDLDVLAVVLALPAFLIAWRWPRVATNTLWTLLLCVVIFAVTARKTWPMLIPIAAVGIVSGLASWVDANSRDKATAPERK